MAEKKFDKQENFGWGYTFELTDKVPATAKRIGDTYFDMMSFVNNPDESAIEGLLLTVVNEQQDNVNKNGVYFVEKVGTFDVDGNQKNDGKVKKVSVYDIKTANNYENALRSSGTLNPGHLIKITSDSVHNGSSYKAGFYIVEEPGFISALGTSGEVAEDKDVGKPIYIDGSTFENLLDGGEMCQGGLSQLNLQDTDFETTDVCIGGYYPTKKVFVENGIEFHYYTSEENDLRKISFVVNTANKSGELNIINVAITDSELYALFQITSE